MRQYLNGPNDPMPPSEVIARSYPAVPVTSDYPVVDSVRPLNYFSLLFSRKGTLALFALAGLVLGTALMWPQPYVYRSHAYLEVTGTNENLLNRRELDPTARPDDNSQVYVNTVARLLQSNPLYTRAATQLNAGGTWNPPITGKEIARNLRVITHDTDRIVELVDDSTDPNRAAAIVNGVTSTFIQQDLDSRWQAANSTNSWLTKQLDELSAKLRTSEAQLEAFTRQSNLLIDGGDAGPVADGFVRNLQGELARAQADRVLKEAAYERSKLGNAVPPADTTYDTYQQQLTGLQKQLAELEATYEPGYYKIPPLKAQIAQMERALKTQRDTAVARVEGEYRSALRREDLLRNQYDAQLRTATDQTSKMVQYAALKNQVEMNRSVYAMMMQKVKSYGVASAIQASNVRVVDPATAALLPVRPNKPMVAMLISFGFLCVGVFWVLARAGANRTIMEPGESKQYLRAPELGVIPMASQSGIKGLGGVETVGLPPVRFARWKNGNGRLETVTWRMSSSLLAESFRSTSASLLLPGQGRDDHRVLVVTSVSPSEGKTTVASNMAIALAGVAGRVLLIDGDRRRARLHKVFGCDNEKGISDLLLPDGVSTVTPEDCIVETAIPNLFLLPSGAGNLNSSDALYSGKMARLIEQFRSEFNLVLIDTPPLLNLADARVLGRISDGVILVIRAGRVPWESAMAVEQRLYDDGIQVLGTILNDWDPKKSGYGAYPYNKSVKAYFAA
jgi:polysaccharide biosynthesis transport protein